MSYGGFGGPPQPGYGAQPGGAPGGYGAPPAGAPGGYGAPPGGYGAPPPQAGYQPPGGFGGYGAPQVDPQVASWFHAVDKDRSGHINIFELQQALTNANWSHFNPETCRLMIGMFDRDNNGTIDLNEFQALWTYINQWKAIFDQFDRDRSGSIDSIELNNAYNTLGYRLSPQFSQLVVCRYDIHNRSRLPLDSFIQSCVLLKSITDTFRQKDPQGQGRISIAYEEFMTMVMLNKP